MGHRTTISKPNKPKSRSTRERQLVAAIEAYVARRGDYLELASLGAERKSNEELASRQAALASAEAALIPLLEGRLPVVFEGYFYACEGRSIRAREVQPID